MRKQPLSHTKWFLFVLSFNVTSYFLLKKLGFLLNHLRSQCPLSVFHSVWLSSLRFDSQVSGMFSFSSYMLFGYCSLFLVVAYIVFFVSLLYPWPWSLSKWKKVLNFRFIFIGGIGKEKCLKKRLRGSWNVLKKTPYDVTLTFASWFVAPENFSSLAYFLNSEINYDVVSTFASWFWGGALDPKNSYYILSKEIICISKQTAIT